MNLTKLTKEEIKDLDFILGWFDLQVLNEDFIFTRKQSNLNLPEEITTSDVSVLPVMKRRIENEMAELKKRNDKEFILELIDSLSAETITEEEFKFQLNFHNVPLDFAKEVLEENKLDDEVIEEIFKITPEEQLDILIKEYLRVMDIDGHTKREQTLLYDKKMLLLAGIHGLLMAGVEVSKEYEHVFHGNNSAEFFKNVIRN